MASGKSGAITELENVSGLLRRLPIQVDEDLIKEGVVGRTVLVTGAGGTIGSEIARQLLSLGAARLVLLDHSERGLFWIDQELSELASADIAVKAVLGSICDRGAVENLLASHSPDIVFHAAAYKHVAMVESNQIAGIHTNVIGTHILLESCRAGGVDRFLLISSDKAANPFSLMGVTKRCAELLTCATAGDKNKYASVRFGNVLGSSGSVVRIFEKRIAERRHLEIRHRDAIRYFMSKEEAGRLLLLVSTMATGGEIFVLETGEGVRILDLARQLILRTGGVVRMPGETHEGIEIRFTALKSGEKLIEELYGASIVQPTGDRHVKKIDETRPDSQAIMPLVADLEVACSHLQPGTATEILKDIMAL